MTILAALILLAARAGFAAGTLTPKGSPHAPIQIRDHRVEVVINNGFARTEVTQTFFNPNDADLEAIYSFPLPKSASLSEVTIWAGEQELNGEVVEKDEAKRIYEEERDQGNDAGLAGKESYKTFDFNVSRVPAGGETRIRFVYYQPLAIDTGIGRYVYPLAEGGTDEVAEAFWTRNPKVEGTFAVHLELKSAWPVTDVRVPGFENAATIDKKGEGHAEVKLEAEQASLERDFVFYYRLADGLPGRVELVPYRAASGAPGTFMLVVTPGVDLGPIAGGADYCFVLDVSGSMETKLSALTRGVTRALGQMRPDDRFRIVVFREGARDLTGGFLPATAQNVAAALGQVESLTADGGTNLYAGLDLALKGLDNDRATSVVLVTDGVTNTGVVDPAEFHRLLARYDVRVFGFVMGNSGNWPLMQAIGQASGGFSAAVSNDDDIVGQILLAKSKITSEALHDVDLAIRGVKVSDLSERPKKIYRGQQLVLFGRYEAGGQATVTLKARLTGEDKTYTATFALPETDTENLEIERLWALDRVEEIGMKADAGLLPQEEARAAIRDLGLAYQLVTDHTSMVILSDAKFEERGIERRNRARVAAERVAQALRHGQPVRSRRVDEKTPMFDRPSATLGSGKDGGGAFDPLLTGLAAAMAGLGLAGITGTRQRPRS
jgi:Ca-activated chloride channel family protein